MIRLALVGPQGSGKTELVRFLRALGISVVHYSQDTYAEQNMGSPELAVHEFSPDDTMHGEFNAVLDISSFRRLR